MQTYEEVVSEWETVKKQLDRLKAKELTLRTILFEQGFPTPKVGVNKLELIDGRIVKATHKINESISSKDVGQMVNKIRETGYNEDMDTLFTLRFEYNKKKMAEAPSYIYKVVEQYVSRRPATPQIEVI